MSNTLNRPLHDFLGLTPAIILTILFCNINISFLVDELPRKLFQLHYEVKVGKINWSFSVADM
jgi:hypothetical protein